MYFNRFDVVGCTLFDYVAGWRIDFATEADAKAAMHEAQTQQTVMEFKLAHMRAEWDKTCVGMSKFRPMDDGLLQRSNTELMA